MTPRYLFYPGHLGPRPVTELTQQRGILWDAPVKRVPEPYVESLMTDGGFQLALDHAEAAKALGRPKKQLDELVEAGALHAEVYRPARQGKAEIPVIVLPAGMSAAALKAHLETQTTQGTTDE